MSTLGTLRQRLRLDLRDTDAAAYRWEDASLDRHLLRAVREISLHVPWQRASLLEADGSRSLEVASLAGRLEVTRAESPPGRWPAALVPFREEGDVLHWLGPAPPPEGAPVRLVWHALHQLDAAGSSLPASLEDLAVTGAAGYAALEQVFATADSFNLGGPATPQVLRGLAESRLAVFQRELRRLDRRRRLRPAFLAPGG